MGAYHTLDLELQRNFTIQKAIWDTVVLDRLEEACDPVKQAEVAALVMQPGLANVCLLTGSMTIVRQRIEVCIYLPKIYNDQERDRQIDRYLHVPYLPRRYLFTYREAYATPHSITHISSYTHTHTYKTDAHPQETRRQHRP